MDIFVLIHAILYFGIVIGGFVISISIGVTRSKIKDICILYADFKKSDDTSIAYYVHSSAVSNCDFPVYFSVFAFILYGLLSGAANVFILVKKSKSEWGSSFMCVVPFIAINALVTLVTFIMACMISVGFKQFCDQIEEYGFKSCSLIDDIPWLKGIEDDHTYRSMSAAEVCAWICFLLWAIQTGLYVFKFIRNRRVSRQHNTETTANKPKENEPTSHPVF